MKLIENKQLQDISGGELGMYTMYSVDGYEDMDGFTGGSYGGGGGGDFGGNGSYGSYGGNDGNGGGNLLDMAGLNSSQAFTQIDHGDYSYNSPVQPPYAPSIWESIGVGIKTVAEDCLAGANDALGMSKAKSVLSPNTSFNGRVAAAIGCGVGIGSGLFRSIQNL